MLAQPALERFLRRTGVVLYVLAWLIPMGCLVLTPFLRTRLVLDDRPPGARAWCGNSSLAAHLPMIGVFLLAWVGSASSAVASAASGAALLTLFPAQRTLTRSLLIVGAALSILAFPFCFVVWALMKSLRIL